MNKISKTQTLFITTLILLIMSVPSFALKRTETFDLSPGKKIVIDLKPGGSIDINGWDKPKAEITVSGHGDPDDYELIFDKTDYGLKITGSLAHKWNYYSGLNLLLNVPHKIDIDLFTSGGEFTLKNVDGNFEGKTNGGEINLEGVKGEVDIKTNGGGIKVINSEVDGKAHTNGGAVLVLDVAGNLSVSTNGGAVTYRNVSRKNSKVNDSGDPENKKDVKEDSVHITTGGGAIDVDGVPYGAVVYTGGGSIQINNTDNFVEAKTGGGSVSINNADNFVKAQTGGGNIDIGIKSGKVEATTGGGDIDVTIEQDTKNDGGVTIFTGSGDVSVTVPPKFSMELDIDLSYTRNSFKDYKIISDFDFKIEEMDKWDNSQGSPRKHIYGTGKVAGGRHKIKIRAVNGSVEIKKR